MQLSPSIPSPGLGGVVPASPAMPCDPAGSGPTSASTPADFARLFAGLTCGAPSGVMAATPGSAGWLGSGPLITGEAPEDDGGDVNPELAEADEEPASGGESDPASGPAAETGLAEAMLAPPSAVPPPPAWLTTRAEPEPTGGFRRNEESDTDGAASGPAGDVRQKGTLGRMSGSAVTPPPAWAAGLPASLSSPWAQTYGDTPAAPDAAADDSGVAPLAARTVQEPATPVTLPTAAAPALPGAPALAAKPAVTEMSPDEPKQAPVGRSDCGDQPERWPTTPAGSSLPRRIGKWDQPRPVPTMPTFGTPLAEGMADAGGEPAEVRPEAGAEVLLKTSGEDPAAPVNGEARRRNLDDAPAGLALGRNRADALAASSPDGLRPPAPAMARASTQPGAEGRTAFRRPVAGGVEVPAENIAGAATEGAGRRSEAGKPSLRTFLNNGEEGLERDGPALGTDVAKGEPAMSLTSFQRRPLADFVPPTATLTTTTGLGEAPRAQVFSETASASRVALRAVNAVAEVKEQIAAGGSSVVNMRFSVAGADLTVRVEARGGEVQVTFRSDSAELRSALAEEWQAVSASEAGRPLRAIDPVFAPAGNPGRESSEGRAAEDAAMSYQRDPESRHPEDPPVRSHPTQRFSAGQTARVLQVAPSRATLFSPDHRLQAFA